MTTVALLVGITLAIGGLVLALVRWAIKTLEREWHGQH